MNERPPYVVITPARNEGLYVQKTIDSVVAQTVRPQKWIIVNDGSNDHTGSLIDAAASQHSWIQAVHRKDRGSRKQGGGVIETFYEGFRFIEGQTWDFIVKLDCDLSFREDYFEQLLANFSRDKTLGIASGVYLENRSGDDWVEVRMPAYHAAGASKMIRRQCFEEIGGFIPARGWDTVDEIRALARGWRTGHFSNLQMKHWKLEGAALGPVRTSVMHGEIYYLTSGSKSFFLLKVLHRLVTRPVLIGGLALLWGYLKLWLRRTPRLVTEAEARCYRELLNSRITSWFKARRPSLA